jgi:hypothetical protein
MAAAPSPSTRSRRQLRRVDPPPRWRRWLALGLFFGLGYGMTQRLLEVRWGEGGSRTPAFRAKPPAGGTSLEELRRRNGSSNQPLTADLDTLARQRREDAAREERERQKAANAQEAPSPEDRRQRLDALDNAEEPAPPVTTGENDAPPPTPSEPDNSPPVPFSMEEPPSPPAGAENRPDGATPTPP